MYNIYTYNDDNSDEYQYYDGFEVTDASIGIFNIILLVLFVVSGIISLTLLSPLWVLTAILGSSALLSLLLRYKYVFGEDLFIGFISLFIFSIVSVVVVTMMQFIKRN